MRFDAPVRVGWFRLSFCVADSDDKDIDIDDERFSSSFVKIHISFFGPITTFAPVSPRGLYDGCIGLHGSSTCKAGIRTRPGGRAAAAPLRAADE